MEPGDVAEDVVRRSEDKSGGGWGADLTWLGCRKAVVCTTGEDPLRWRGHVYLDGLKGSGWLGMVEAKESDNVGHVFFLNDLESKEAKDLMTMLVALFNARDE